MTTLITSIKNQAFFWVIALLFICANAIMLSAEQYWFMLIPFALGIIALTFLAIDKMLLLLIFLTPLSVVLDQEIGVSFALPTEPIAFGLMAVFWLKIIIEGKFDTAVLKHPLTIAIGLHLLWMLFTAIGSSMPSVSLKFFLVHFWNASIFYLFMSQLFRKKTENIVFNFWAYIIPLCIVATYALARHIPEGLTHKGSGWVMEPFYIDHGVYGAAVAFVVPMVFGTIYMVYHYWKKPQYIIWLIPAVLLISSALILSYARAAWISVAAALGFYLLLKLKVKMRTLLMALLGAGMLFAVFQNDILQQMNRNKTDSGKNIENQIKSMSNIRTDASNMERLNRWYSAYRMFEERPLLGWGPGTYMFNYAAYQKPEDMTIISTNLHTLGGIHSEYFGPGVESGILGFILFFTMVILSVFYGMETYYLLEDGKEKTICLLVLLGLITYLVHGCLNNYLDQDKTATLFWMSLSAILCLNLRAKELHSAESEN